MQSKEKLKSQTWENKNLILNTILAYLNQIWDPKIFFGKISLNW